MRKSRLVLGAAVPLFLLSAFTAHASGPLTVHEAMTTVIAPKVQIFWDITNQVLSDDGLVEVDKVTPAQWQQLATAIQDVEDSARQLSQARSFTITKPGVKIQDEGNPGALGAKEVQKLVSANPQDFAEHAGEFLKLTERLSLAVRNRDSAELSELATSIDGACEDCHHHYWYPGQ